MGFFDLEMALAKRHSKRVLELRELRKVWHENDVKKERIPTHKLVTFYLFVILNVVLIYSLVAMWHFADLTHLGLLITDIVGQLVTFMIYSHHSTAQNSKDGINYLALQNKLNVPMGRGDIDDGAVG